jgi:hypothetical protein
MLAMACCNMKGYCAAATKAFSIKPLAAAPAATQI